jgi:diguanylate cyclase (GGDEF)-like protein
MRAPRVGPSGRFFVALVVVVLALAGAVGVSLRGLGAVHAVNGALFSDNLLTGAATSRLIGGLSRTEVVSLEISDARTPAATADLRTALEEAVIPAVQSDLAAVMRIHDGDPAPERAEIARIPPMWRAVLSIIHQRLLASGRIASDPATEDLVRMRLDPLIAYVTARQPREIADATAAHAAATVTYDRSRMWIFIAAILDLVAAASMIRAGWTLRDLLRTQARDRKSALRSSEYTMRLQATEDESEAHDLLRRQLERNNPGSRAVVLSRNNSANRLEPRTPVTDLGELRSTLEHAEPRSCLAVRFATGHVESGGRDALATCTVCGELPGASICEPLLVGGEVIGSVLVSQPVSGAAPDPLTIRDTVAQAAPVLANLRNLALAERRAATDLLTALPNQRSVQDTLKRMVAQASRLVAPLGAVLVDLDHFKQVNDVYGHDRGDDVLAAVGVALRSAVRESDFVGRYGGEEFLVLLPGTGRDGAAHVAEAIRSTIAAIRITGVDRDITASCGVAILPGDARDAVTLFRAADRALYQAKHDGRNRVQVLGVPASPSASASASAAAPTSPLTSRSPSPNSAASAADTDRRARSSGIVESPMSVRTPKPSSSASVRSATSSGSQR